MVGAHYPYSYHLYYLVLESLGPPFQEKREGTEKTPVGEVGRENRGHQFHLKCGTGSPTPDSHPIT